MTETSEKSYYFLDTVGRAVAVLEMFCNTEAELGVTQAARGLNIHKSVAHRLLATLADLDMLAPGSVEGTYRLGAKSLRLGLSYLRHSPIERVAQSHLQRLAVRFPDLAFHVAILEGTNIVYQKSVSGPQASWVSATVGRGLPAYCTSLGKVLLAYLSPGELETYLSRVELRPFTQNTVTSPDRLRKELAEIRARGWSFDNEEFMPAHQCVGAPVRDHTGRVVAALSIATITSAPNRYELGCLAEAVRAAATDISRDLGYASAA